jgi:hypothetical protein
VTSTLRHRIVLGAARISGFALLPFLLISCGGSFESAPLDPGLRAILERTVEQSLRDSALYVASALHGTGSLSVDMMQGGDSVRIRDRFAMEKRSGQPLDTRQLMQTVIGDTSILSGLYSFRAPGTKERAFEATQLDRMYFDADFRKLLRRIIAGRERSAVKIVDSAAAIDGRKCLLVSYETSDGHGSFAVDRQTMELVKVDLGEESDYMIAGYSYSLGARYTRPAGGPVVPVSMTSTFDFHRPFSHGSGTIVVVFDSVALR